MTMTLRVLVRGAVIYRKYNYCFVTARELFPILLVVVPILLLAIILIASKASGTFKKVQEALDKVNTKLQENLSGVVL